MPTNTVEIHIRQRGFEPDTIADITAEALKISFEGVRVTDFSVKEDRVTIAVTLQSKEDRHDTDLSVRTAVENLLKNTPLDVISTETSYSQLDAGRTPPSVEHLS